jgi:hypothetical protein
LRHQLAALLHELEPGQKIEHARGEQRVVLAQAMACHIVRTHALTERPPIVQRIDYVETGLSELGFFQPVIRVLQTQVAHGISDQRIDLLFDREVLAHLVEQALTHAAFLRSLTGKHESNHFGLHAMIFMKGSGEPASILRSAGTWRQAFSHSRCV